MPIVTEPVDVNAFHSPAQLGARLHGSGISETQIQRICEERARGPFANEHDLATRLNASLPRLHPLRFGAKKLKCLQVGPSDSVSRAPPFCASPAVPARALSP